MQSLKSRSFGSGLNVLYIHVQYFGTYHPAFPHHDESGIAFPARCFCSAPAQGEYIFT